MHGSYPGGWGPFEAARYGQPRWWGLHHGGRGASGSLESEFRGGDIPWSRPGGAGSESILMRRSISTTCAAKCGSSTSGATSRRIVAWADRRGERLGSDELQHYRRGSVMRLRVDGAGWKGREDRRIVATQAHKYLFHLILLIWGLRGVHSVRFSRRNENEPWGTYSKGLLM